MTSHVRVTSHVRAAPKNAAIPFRHQKIRRSAGTGHPRILRVIYDRHWITRMQLARRRIGLESREGSMIANSSYGVVVANDIVIGSISRNNDTLGPNTMRGQL